MLRKLMGTSKNFDKKKAVLHIYCAPEGISFKTVCRTSLIKLLKGEIQDAEKFTRVSDKSITHFGNQNSSRFFVEKLGSEVQLMPSFRKPASSPGVGM